MAATTNITSIPAPRVPLVDERTGLISREWDQFLLNLFTLSGGGQNDTTLADLQVGPFSSGLQASVAQRAIEDLQVGPSLEPAALLAVQRAIEDIQCAPVNAPEVPLWGNAAGGPTDLDLLQYNLTNARWETGATAWLDIDFPILIRAVGPNIPTLVAVNGNLSMPQWAVNDFNMCEAQEFIHSWKEGSLVSWHLHMTTNGLEAVNKYVRFELEYGYADVNGVWVFPAVFTSADILIPANTPSKTMLIGPLTTFTPNLKIGAHCVARLKRVASVGAAPAANPWVPMLQMHIQLNTLGSRTISTK